ncbi:cytochrome c oxidase assembly factor CtaG [Variovorax boronicumulans]|uniref:Cytochrome c oxidase assembly factor CtaG n=1 Tax=Variovorax boronicumulans TaxID=436515 RepID=A0AAW8CY50_9BURK|nr:cytochrome c oxidase assembly factor CtaG [Variovorax boronicumulans]MDQ0056367.1 cytochrome c oxidase assembly factor CtaG [Variovorax boronicumulans]
MEGFEISCNVHYVKLLEKSFLTSTSPASGLDPLEDQQLCGLVMWVPAGLAYLAVGLTLAAR